MNSQSFNLAKNAALYRRFLQASARLAQTERDGHLTGARQPRPPCPHERRIWSVREYRSSSWKLL